jgi:hypothetical protein
MPLEEVHLRQRDRVNLCPRIGRKRAAIRFTNEEKLQFNFRASRSLIISLFTAKFPEAGWKVWSLTHAKPTELVPVSLGLSLLPNFQFLPHLSFHLLSPIDRQFDNAVFRPWNSLKQSSN